MWALWWTNTVCGGFSRACSVSSHFLHFANSSNHYPSGLSQSCLKTFKKLKAPSDLKQTLDIDGSQRPSVQVF